MVFHSREKRPIAPASPLDAPEYARALADSESRDAHFKALQMLPADARLWAATVVQAFHPSLTVREQTELDWMSLHAVELSDQEPLA